MKKIIGTILCLLVPSLAWAVSARDCEFLVTDLSKAIEEYKALGQELGDNTYDIVLRRDPMQALVDDEGNVVNPAGFHAGLAVQGIIRSKNLKRILVDDVLYSEGSMVGPYRILEIKENGFWASEDGEKIFVPLYSESSASKNPDGSPSK